MYKALYTRTQQQSIFFPEIFVFEYSFVLFFNSFYFQEDILASIWNKALAAVSWASKVLLGVINRRKHFMTAV